MMEILQILLGILLMDSQPYKLKITWEYYD